MFAYEIDRDGYLSFSYDIPLKNSADTSILPSLFGFVMSQNGEQLDYDFHFLSTETSYYANIGGEFKAGKKHGHGVLTQEDGTKIEGEWKDDEFQQK